MEFRYSSETALAAAANAGTWKEDAMELMLPCNVLSSACKPCRFSSTPFAAATKDPMPYRTLATVVDIAMAADAMLRGSIAAAR
jgi:hypothetical protein